jgi:hypothetical protein
MIQDEIMSFSIINIPLGKKGPKHYKLFTNEGKNWGFIMKKLQI